MGSPPFERTLRFWRHLETYWNLLGPFRIQFVSSWGYLCESLGLLDSILSHLGNHLGLVCGHFGVLLRHLVGNLGLYWPILGSLGGLLGRFGSSEGYLGTLQGHLEPSWNPWLGCPTYRCSFRGLLDLAHTASLETDSRF